MSVLAVSATAVALFLLYTNLLVVVVQRGLVPQAITYVVPALLLAAVLLQTVIRRRSIVLDRTLLAMMAFLVVLLLSSFMAEGQSVATSRIGVFLGEGTLIYFLVRNAVRTLPEIRVAAVAIVAAACLLAGLAVIQNVTGDYDQDFLGLAQRNLELSNGQPAVAGAEIGIGDRSGGPVNEPNRFAQILLVAAPLALVFGLNALRRRTAVLAWACVGLLLVAVLLTYSRGALLTIFVLGIVAVPLRLVRPARLVGALAIGGLLTAATIPGVTTRVASLAGVAGLFGQSRVEPDGPTRGRTTEMLAALAAFNDHPVLGVGPGQYVAYHSVRYQDLPEVSIRDIPVPRRAHNLYLEVAAETGTVGLVVFMTIPLLLLAELGRLRRALYLWRPDLARLAAGFTLALLAYLGTGVFLHLAFERYYWVMIALAASVVGMLEKVPTPEPVGALDPMEERAWA